MEPKEGVARHLATQKKRLSEAKQAALSLLLLVASQLQLDKGSLDYKQR